MLKAILSTIFVAAFFTVGTVGNVTVFSDYASAKKVDKTKKKKKKKFEKLKSDTGETLYEFCAKFDDNEQTTNSKGDQFRCCSKDANFCVICPLRSEEHTSELQSH